MLTYHLLLISKDVLLIRKNWLGLVNFDLFDLNKIIYIDSNT